MGKTVLALDQYHTPMALAGRRNSMLLSQSMDTGEQTTHSMSLSSFPALVIRFTHIIFPSIWPITNLASL